LSGRSVIFVAAQASLRQGLAKGWRLCCQIAGTSGELQIMLI